MRVLDLHPEKQLHLKKNIGSTDRLVRVLAAILLVGMIIVDIIPGGALAICALILAAAFILTSFISYSPLYTILGLNSYHHPKAS